MCNTNSGWILIYHGRSDGMFEELTHNNEVKQVSIRPIGQSSKICFGQLSS